MKTRNNLLPSSKSCLLLGGCAIGVLAAATGLADARDPRPDRSRLEPQRTQQKLQRPTGTLLLAIGDSLTHGTMDATNNQINTENAYLQLVADSLALELPIVFSQPFFNEKGERLRPRTIPTNLAVDGADVFSSEGIEYGPRAGEEEDFEYDGYLCDNRLALRLDSAYDRVLYPINVKAGASVSAVDAAVWHLQETADLPEQNRAIVVVWIGNNDASAAALGGGAKPASMPIPYDLASPEMTVALNALIQFGISRSEVAFEPYSMTMIERNLTTLDDFTAQYEHVLARLETEGALNPDRYDLFLLTLPYYSSVGYLVDSEDLEFYLRKFDPSYTVPPTFARVAPPGEPITDPLAGDRVSLLTFGSMFLLMEAGYTSDYVNGALEVNGVQRDGLVLSQVEQEFVQARIDGYNDSILAAAANRGNQVHLVDAGGLLNDALTGKVEVIVGGKQLSRKWVRGGGFSLDGVHPSYTGHALIANGLIEHMNAALHISAQLVDLESVLLYDPYIDWDGDGFAPGPDYSPSGMTELLFFLTDADDNDASIGPDLPDNVWRLFSRALLRDLIGIPGLQAEAERLGLTPDGL